MADAFLAKQLVRHTKRIDFTLERKVGEITDTMHAHGSGRIIFGVKRITVDYGNQLDAHVQVYDERWAQAYHLMTGAPYDYY
jgi:hypothetical protein